MKSGPAAADIGRGQGGELRASPQRAVSNEPTLATGKRRAARRVFAQKAVWLRCSSLTDPPGICSLLAPRNPAFCAKTGSVLIFKRALSVAFCHSYVFCFLLNFVFDLSQPYRWFRPKTPALDLTRKTSPATASPHACA